MAKNPPANAGDMRDVGLIPGSGRSPGGGNDNPLQYSCLENPMDRGIWQATVHRVTKSRTQLKCLSTLLLFEMSQTDKVKLLNLKSQNEQQNKMTVTRG